MTGDRHLLLTTDAIGGVWQYAVDLAEALDPHGYRTTLAIIGPAASSAQRAQAGTIPQLQLLETGLALEWLASEPEQVIATEARLSEIAGDLQADIVQLHSPALTSIGRYPRPVLAMLHSCVATWWSAVRQGPMPDDFNWRAAQIADGLRRADAVVTPTAAFGEAVYATYGVTPLPVHNGRRCTFSPASQRDEVFTAGRLWDEAKNVRLLDDVAARIAVPFRAAGSARSPHGDRIALQHLQLLGTLDEAGIAAHLGSRPLFVSAALYEPFGLSVLEAAIAGCALIVSDIPTFRELWDGVATFVHPHDVGGFVAAIEHYLSDADGRQAAGDAARHRARRYTPAATAKRMAELYDRLQTRVAA